MKDSRKETAVVRVIDGTLRLVPYYENIETALPWYQDRELCRQVDNKDRVYSPQELKQMYDFLCGYGYCYYIEYEGKLVGDATLRDNGEICIVICREYQNKHIGRHCVAELLTLARELAFDKVTAEIYSFNEQSRRMFLAAGFVQTDDEFYEYRL